MGPHYSRLREGGDRRGPECFFAESEGQSRQNVSQERVKDFVRSFLLLIELGLSIFRDSCLTVYKAGLRTFFWPIVRTTYELEHSFTSLVLHGVERARVMFGECFPRDFYARRDLHHIVDTVFIYLRNLETYHILFRLKSVSIFFAHYIRDDITKMLGLGEDDNLNLKPLY